MFMSGLKLLNHHQYLPNVNNQLAPWLDGVVVKDFAFVAENVGSIPGLA